MANYQAESLNHMLKVIVRLSRHIGHCQVYFCPGSCFVTAWSDLYGIQEWTWEQSLPIDRDLIWEAVQEGEMLGRFERDLYRLLKSAGVISARLKARREALAG